MEAGEETQRIEEEQEREEEMMETLQRNHIGIMIPLIFIEFFNKLVLEKKLLKCIV